LALSSFVGSDAMAEGEMTRASGGALRSAKLPRGAQSPFWN
jgi:hypothetical protein